MVDSTMTDTTPNHRETTGQRTVYLETFGCQMNVLDSQLVTSALRAQGYAFIERREDADVVLYNTCSVREHAEQKVLSRVGQVALAKRDRPELVLGVIGCMAEQFGKKMVRKYPQIDVMCGPGELDHLPGLIDNAVRNARQRAEDQKDPAPSQAQIALQGNTHRRSGTLAAAEDQLELLDLSRSFSADQVQNSAYVRITRGCNKFCTYCVVPFTRGAEVHRPPDHIVSECRQLADAGVTEITLLGQTVNHYHYDHGASVTVGGMQQPQIGGTVTQIGIRGVTSSKVTTFADLLRRIHEQVPGIARLRFVTSYPRDFGDDILEVMRDSPRICRYLHLPAQSGSNRMLKLMNRDYTVESYLELLDRVRSHLPDVMLAGDVICGFPTETQADHEATIDLLRRARYKNCFIFKYSPRPGTVAIDRFEDDVPEAVKKQRNNELLAVQGEISDEIHQSMVGQTVRVFVESVSTRARKQQTNAAGQSIELGWDAPTTQLTGRTDGDLIVMIEGPERWVGQTMEVTIDRAAPLTLFGRPVKEHAPLSRG